MYDEYTPEQQAEIAVQVREYLDAPEGKEDGIIELDSVRKMREILKQVCEINSHPCPCFLFVSFLAGLCLSFFLALFPPSG